MTKIPLSKRLEAVASLIYPAGGSLRIADIGSDHAHLPCRLIQEGIASFAIAGEVREGPLMQAQTNVRTLGMMDKVSVRLGDGLDVVARGEADIIVIAGMGGELMTTILERGQPKLTEETTLVLQPNIREPSCRGWLASNGWRIEDETIVEEDGHFYEMMRAVKGSRPLTETERMMGPILSEEQSTVFRKKWQRRLGKLDQIIHALDQAEQTASVIRKKEKHRKEQDRIRTCLDRQTSAH